jgi:hypothetical protein
MTKNLRRAPGQAVMKSCVRPVPKKRKNSTTSTQAAPRLSVSSLARSKPFCAKVATKAPRPSA